MRIWGLSTPNQKPPTLRMGTTTVFLLILVFSPCLTLAAKLQGFTFLDNNSTKKVVEGQGNVTMEFPGKEFPLHLSFCFKFNLDYYRFMDLPLLDITNLQIQEHILNIGLSGGVRIYSDSTGTIYWWKFVKQTKDMLRTWTTLCLAMDFNQSTAALAVNGIFKNPQVSLCH